MLGPDSRQNFSLTFLDIDFQQIDPLHPLSSMISETVRRRHENVTFLNFEPRNKSALSRREAAVYHECLGGGAI